MSFQANRSHGKTPWDSHGHGTASSTVPWGPLLFHNRGPGTMGPVGLGRGSSPAEPWNQKRKGAQHERRRRVDPEIHAASPRPPGRVPETPGPSIGLVRRVHRCPVARSFIAPRRQSLLPGDRRRARPSPRLSCGGNGGRVLAQDPSVGRIVIAGSAQPGQVLFVRTIHQIWIHHPILGDLPFGHRFESPTAPLPVDRFDFDDPLDAHEACILLEDYLGRHRATKPRKRK